VIGNAYEFLIKNFASTSGKKAGEFYTPPEVSTLMARLMDPQPGDEICDPTCGSGSLLMKCGRLIRQRTGSRKYALYGQEAIGSTWALAKMNMFLHGEDNHRIEWGDTIRNPKLLDSAASLKHFDIVVANPPFSLEKWGFEGRRGRQVQPLPPRPAAAHQGRLRLHPAHGRNHEARHRPHGRGRAAWRAVPWRGRRAHPPEAD
jgi:type I restriction enzyme M protein